VTSRAEDIGRATRSQPALRVDESGELSAKKIVDRQGCTFLEVQNFARRTIGVNHIPAPLHKDVARQGFEERPLLARQNGNISF
jgi:hypothetical protein